jgi:methyl-accepting chemotaxis protein
VSIKRLTVKSKLLALIAVFTVGLIAYGAWSYNTLNVVKVHGPYYQRIVDGKDLVADVLPPPLYILESYLLAFQLAGGAQNGADRSTLEPIVAELRRLRSDYDQRHVVWTKNLPEGPLKQALLHDSRTPAIDFFRVLDAEFVPAA